MFCTYLNKIAEENPLNLLLEILVRLAANLSNSFLESHSSNIPFPANVCIKHPGIIRRDEQDASI